MSGRVISSGYIPPVSSKSARRSKLSELRWNVRITIFHQTESP